jgi:hypothetical protein
MSPSELIFVVALVVALLGLAVFFALNQKKTIFCLRTDQTLVSEERTYLRKQVRRRLICSVLMTILAGMLVGWCFLEQRLPQSDQPRLNEPAMPPHMNESQKADLRFLIVYWSAALIVFLGLLFLAAADFMATARFGVRRQRQLNAEQRQMLEAELARWRHERNGS